VYENRPGRLVLDIGWAGPEPRTIEPSETLRFDVVSSCPMGEQDTDDGNYDVVFMERVHATSQQILPVPIKMGPHCRIPFHMSVPIHAEISQTTLLCNPKRSLLHWELQV
jgi:hypothetical protein